MTNSLRRLTFAPNPNTVSSHQPPNADENSIFSSFESVNLESASVFARFCRESRRIFLGRTLNISSSPYGPNSRLRMGL